MLEQLERIAKVKQFQGIERSNWRVELGTDLERLERIGGAGLAKRCATQPLYVILKGGKNLEVKTVISDKKNNLEWCRHYDSRWIVGVKDIYYSSEGWRVPKIEELLTLYDDNNEFLREEIEHSCFMGYWPRPLYLWSCEAYATNLYDEPICEITKRELLRYGKIRCAVVRRRRRNTKKNYSEQITIMRGRKSYRAMFMLAVRDIGCGPSWCLSQLFPTIRKGDALISQQQDILDDTDEDE